nr:hypothetical protein [uncultured Leptotrichia sp.]
MKKSLLLLTLGILGICQLGHSENMDVKVEKTQNTEVKQIQEEVTSNETENIENAGTELNQKQEEEEISQTTKQTKKETSKAKKLTPEQERRLEAKARRNKEKNMTLDEKLDFQILKMERMLKNLEGR